MFNIILIALLIHYIFFFLKNSPTSILACGIFGWAGRDVRSFNKDRLNILGLSNQSRGKDSCGLGVNGEIFIGHGTTKLYEDFLKVNYHEKVFKPSQVKTIIGHTRNASVGSISYENAHPFGFGIHNENYSFLGIHLLHSIGKNHCITYDYSSRLIQIVFFLS